MGLLAKQINSNPKLKSSAKEAFDNEKKGASNGEAIVSLATKKALRAKRKADEEARNHKPMSRMGDTQYREVNDSFGNSSQMGGERRFMGEIASGLGGNRELGEADWRRRSREVRNGWNR